MVNTAFPKINSLKIIRKTKFGYQTGKCSTKHNMGKNLCYNLKPLFN